MVRRNEKGQFMSEKTAYAADLRFYVSEWKRWALDAFRNGDRADAKLCMAEMRDCRQKLNALSA